MNSGYKLNTEKMFIFKR